MSVVSPEYKTSKFVGNDPTHGILAAIQTDGSTGVIVSYDPVSGDVTVQSPGGSSGSPTNRIKHENELYVRTNPGGSPATYANVRAWGSITSTPTTVQGYGITNGARLDTANAFAGAITVAVKSSTFNTIDQLAIIANTTWVGANPRVLVNVTKSGAGSGGLGIDASGYTALFDETGSQILMVHAATGTLSGSLLASADNAFDIGAVGARFRNLNLSGNAIVGGSFAANGGAAIAGGYSTNAASQAVVDYASGARFITYGADAATNGVFKFLSRRSDGTNEITVGTTDTGGALTLAHSLTVTGSATISGSVILPSLSAGVASFRQTVQVAILNAATATLSLNYGFCFIANLNTGSTGFVAVAGGAGTVIWPSGGEFTGAVGTAGKTNVYVSAGNLTIQNNTGATGSYAIISLALN